MKLTSISTFFEFYAKLKGEVSIKYDKTHILGKQDKTKNKFQKMGNAILNTFHYFCNPQRVVESKLERS